jgi:hypothetical protein
MNLRQIMKEAFESENSSLKLHAEVVRLRSLGVDREKLIVELKAYHDELKSEADQDLILEVLDCFYGWCSPDFRID